MRTASALEHAKMARKGIGQLRPLAANNCLSNHRRHTRVWSCSVPIRPPTAEQLADDPPGLHRHVCALCHGKEGANSPVEVTGPCCAPLGCAVAPSALPHSDWSPSIALGDAGRLRHSRLVVECRTSIVVNLPSRIARLGKTLYNYLTIPKRDANCHSGRPIASLAMLARKTVELSKSSKPANQGKTEPESRAPIRPP
jgi:hypothetical protein